MPRGTPSWTSNFDRFLIVFCSQLGPRGCQKSVFFQKKKHVFSKNRLSKITSISASILVPKSFPKSTKIPSKIDFQSHRIFDRFSHQFLRRFGSNLGPSWAPSWSHLGSENRPRAAQDAFQDAFGSQNPPRPPKWLQNGAPDPPKWCPRPFILDRFWC